MPDHSANFLLPVPALLDDMVRVGRANDGGYVISRRSMEQARVLIGLGINTDWSFEHDFCRHKPGTKVLALDGSVSRRHFVQQRAVHVMQAGRRLAQRDWHSVRQEWRRSEDYRQLAQDFGEFFQAPDHVFLERMIAEDGFGGAFDWEELVRTVQQRFGSEAETGWFVKMDIEGSEYRVLPRVMEYAERITGLAVEFHDCDLLWDRLEETLRLLDTHFVLAHAHGNNHAPMIQGTTMPRVLELSFVNRRLVKPDELRRLNDRVYPLPGLDMPNHSGLPEYKLSFRTAGSAPTEGWTARG